MLRDVFCSCSVIVAGVSDRVELGPNVAADGADDTDRREHIRAIRGYKSLLKKETTAWYKIRKTRFLQFFLCLLYLFVAAFLSKVYSRDLRRNPDASH